MNIDTLYQIYLKHSSVQTDTRQLKAGDIFFALKGPNFNGNRFALTALDAGAAYAVVDEDVPEKDDRLIYVPDGLEALQQLAEHHRNQLKIPVLGITGSNGKTTTKELIHCVLTTTLKTNTTEGNLNNHIGVPLTLLKIKNDAEIAVVEMGANHLGEITSYCQYARPTHGLITNIGKAHLEGFGSAENVKIGKGELFDFIKEHQGVAFVNADDAAVISLVENLEHKIFYGSKPPHFTGKILSGDPLLSVEMVTDKAMKIHTKLVGAYNLPNVLAAVAIGRHFEVPDEKIKEAIENYQPSNSRSQLIKEDSNTIILDAYNANPGSMKAAIENFASMQGKDKILLLGAMKELGEDSDREHEALISLIKSFSWNAVALTGKEFAAINHPFEQFENVTELSEWFHQQHFHHQMILIKGSRSMQMEKVLERVI